MAEQCVECPKCDPCSPELDEDGRPYTCYFCCDTGRVLRSVVEAEQREQAEYEARALASYRRPEQCPACQHGRGFNCRQCWPSPAPFYAKPVPPFSYADDDIPF